MFNVITLYHTKVQLYIYEILIHSADIGYLYCTFCEAEAEDEDEDGKGELTDDVLNLPSLWTLVHTGHAMRHVRHRRKTLTRLTLTSPQVTCKYNRNATRMENQ